VSSSIMKALVLAALVSSASVVAAQEPASGFLFTDYSKLEPVSEERPGDLYYVAPGTMERMANYHAVLIEQPEIFVHPESKYKGMKPDQMKALADSYAEFVAQALEESDEWPGDESFEVVDEAGPGVLHLRVAIGNLLLKKQRSKNPLSYLPIAATVRLVKNALIQDLAKKVSLVEVTLELEVLDSQTGEVLGAGVWSRGGRGDSEAGLKASPSSWEELEAVMLESGRRTNCRLNNARLPQGQWVDCSELVLRKSE
jgi:hypothetical protein